MRAVVVYESIFGNTERIAHAVAEGLGQHLDVSVVDVDNAAGAVSDDVDLLVVGGPTHAHGMTRPATRKAPGTTREADRIGLREWLPDPANLWTGMPVAVFDTRFNKPPWLVGSAARGAVKRLRRHGCALIAEPESFYVTDTEGPLADGELELAREWGAMLGAAVTSAQRQPAQR